MRLKNIKLAGFKSFVDPTDVHLTSDMVAVVGPNGCGKSNIIDAVRWVMGESSAKNLRGESMTDVIFNGSTGRKPVGQASIELVFDNSDQTLRGEYAAFTEISIKRRVTREGQSQYFLNGTKCRRRDIKDIFLGTGLGPRSYAIIEQGMISRLIESKPEELRVFIEEAAGISKYKERRRETETRIRHARENLERLTDIREELDRQLQKLKRQSAAAEKYKLLRAEEQGLKAQTLSLQWQKLRSDSSEQRDAVTQGELSLEEGIAASRAVEARIEAHRQEHAAKTENFNNVQAAYYRVGGEITRIEQSLEHASDRVRQLGLDLEETEKNSAESLKHLNEDAEKLAIWREELEGIEPEFERLQTCSATSGEKFAEAEAAMQTWQQGWDAFNQEAMEPQKSAEVQRSRIDQIESALKNLVERSGRLEKERIEYADETRQEQLSGLEASALAAKGKLEEAAQLFSGSASELQDRRDALQSIADAINEKQQKLQQSKGRESSLDALQQAARTDQAGQANQWLQQQGLDKAPRLFDQLKVESGWELAVETVLGDRLQAVTVSNIDELEGRVDQLKSSNISFIDNANVSGSDEATLGELQPLGGFVTEGADASLFHGVFVAHELSQAAAARKSLAHNQSIITKDGIWLGPNWLRVLRKKDAGKGVIERQQELEKLGQEIADLESSLSSLGEQRQTSKQALADAEAEKDRLMNEKAAAEGLYNQSQSDIRSFNAQTEQNNRRRQRIDEELKLAEQTQVSQREGLSNARQLLDEAIEAMQVVEEKRVSLEAEKATLQAALTESRESAESDRQSLQQVAVRSEGLRAQIESVSGSVHRLESQIEQLGQRSENLQTSKKEASLPIEGLKTELASQLEARVQQETSLNEARDEVEASEKLTRDLEQERGSCADKVQSIREQLEKARIAIQEMAVRTQTIEEQLVEDGFQLESVIRELPEDAELSLWQENLKEVTAKIDRLGAINLAAIEEFKTESERKLHLDSQNTELETALATLESAIQKIDKETRGLFKETFDQLNSSLQNLFPKVFGGGAAYLEMTGDDLLSTGISIMARPPGKKNSTIHLLSGGEKALTAIALVFSIFQLNPAPFCMLDEVDAPLDDANTGRYARLINEMSDKVQFIFITHNKITMEMADHLMGVTMHEPGCSRLVSVDINEAVEMATA